MSLTKYLRSHIYNAYHIWFKKAITIKKCTYDLIFGLLYLYLIYLQKLFTKNGICISISLLIIILTIL